MARPKFKAPTQTQRAISWTREWQRKFKEGDTTRRGWTASQACHWNDKCGLASSPQMRKEADAFNASND